MVICSLIPPDPSTSVLLKPIIIFLLQLVCSLVLTFACSFSSLGTIFFSYPVGAYAAVILFEILYLF